ncbi:MAG TPA: phosphate signaling complex protein PhoU [Actinomycetota bacterium]|nr:phosphate signaling complex protein PhoU [Actinomycetota bacterium]
MAGGRIHFHEELERLELDILGMGEMAERALGLAMEALAGSDVGLAEKVIAGDGEIDALYLSVEQRTLEVLALQTPVATDLRLISFIFHANQHLERMGDMATNIGKITRATAGRPRSETIVTHLQEMADVVRPMIRAAMDAFSRRDLDLARKLPEMDDPVDRLNRGMWKEVAACAHEQELLEWAVRMMVVSRQLERVGDHAVDIAEQVAFLLTGEFQEFSSDDHG